MQPCDNISMYYSYDSNKAVLSVSENLSWRYTINWVWVKPFTRFCLKVCNIYNHTHTHTRTYTQSEMHVHKHVHTHTHTHTYTHTLMHRLPDKKKTHTHTIHGNTVLCKSFTIQRSLACWGQVKVKHRWQSTALQSHALFLISCSKHEPCKTNHNLPPGWNTKHVQSLELLMKTVEISKGPGACPPLPSPLLPPHPPPTQSPENFESQD